MRTKRRVMTDEEYSRFLATARETNRRRDEVDHEGGFGAPPDNGLFLYLRTAIAAIECGAKTYDWTSVGEGIEMLLSIDKQLARIYDFKHRDEVLKRIMWD